MQRFLQTRIPNCRGRSAIREKWRIWPKKSRFRFRRRPRKPEAASPETWRPKRLVRTCLSSMVDSHEFGRQMERESRRRRFFEAPARAFLGDGLPWNWSIQQTHFRLCHCAFSGGMS